MLIIAKIKDKEITLANTYVPCQDDIIVLENETYIIKAVIRQFTQNKNDPSIYINEKVILMLEELKK